MEHFSIFFAFVLLMALGVVMNDALECDREFKSEVDGVKGGGKPDKQSCEVGVTSCFKFHCEMNTPYEAMMLIKACGTCDLARKILMRGMEANGNNNTGIEQSDCTCEESDAKNPATTTPTTTTTTTTTSQTKNSDNSNESANSASGSVISMFMLGIEGLTLSARMEFLNFLVASLRYSLRSIPSSEP